MPDARQPARLPDTPPTPAHCGEPDAGGDRWQPPEKPRTPASDPRQLRLPLAPEVIAEAVR
jgi:hypothetical protein